MIKTYILTTCLVFLQLFAMGQKTIVYGVVVDAKTKETLPFVNVGFKGTKTGTSTDFDGKYRLESYYVSDSLVFSFLGYETKTVKIKTDVTQEIDIELPESSVTLKAAVITASKKDENPAHVLLKKVIKNKKINNKKKLDTYSYEAYNKVEFDINNIDEKFKNKKMFKKFDFIFDYVDSTDEKPYLPIFITESISDYYYKRVPKKKKEIIKAAKVSGLNNQSISQYLGDMYQSINVYNNSIPIFGRNFVSPITTGALFYYKYYLTDSATIDGNWCYKLEFQAKRKNDLTFAGELWIHDTTYAVKIFQAEISESANINFVNSYSLKQTFKQIEPEVWMLIMDESIVDVNPLENDKQKGIYGRKTASYRNFTINKQIPDSIFEGNENIIVVENAREFSENFWDTARHVTLTEKEKKIYHMIDTVKDLPIVKTYIDIIQTITSGYQIVGPVEIGPYSSLYGYNPIEGNRISLGIQTSNDFSKNVMFSGHLAHGFGDNRFKYALGTKFFLTKKPRRLFEIDYINEVRQFDRDYFAPFSQNLLSSFLRRSPNNKLVNVEGIKFKYYNEWYEGLGNTICFKSFNTQSLDTFLTFNHINGDSTARSNMNSFYNSELTIGMRFAHNEKYLSGEFTRISLGTKYPVIEVNFSLGMKNIFNSQYEYQKLLIDYRHWVNTGYLGYTTYKIRAGKIWGTLPFPLLFVHTGNETWGYEREAFNAMNIGEFISDEFVSLNVEHHFEGIFLNKIPLLRKLKWREVISGKMIYGRLDDKHSKIFELPSYSKSLKEKPYSEVSVGIENIFKILRIDALWRLAYLKEEQLSSGVLRFGIRARLQIRF